MLPDDPTGTERKTGLWLDLASSTAAAGFGSAGLAELVEKNGRRKKIGSAETLGKAAKDGPEKFQRLVDGTSRGPKSCEAEAAA